jgi:hypothetical protein
MCPSPNGFRDRAISLYSTLYTVQTSNTPCPHTSCKVHHWCWQWNFRKCIILGKLLELYSEIALSQKPFGIGHMYIYTFLLRMTYYDLSEYWPFLLGHCIAWVDRMINEYRTIGWMKIFMVNRSTRRTPALMLLCSAQIPHDLTGDRMRAAAVESRQITAWAMARPIQLLSRGLWDPRFLPGTPSPLQILNQLISVHESWLPLGSTTTSCLLLISYNQ